MKHTLVMFLALMLAGCNVTAFVNVFEYDPYAAMQPTSTQAATVTAEISGLELFPNPITPTPNISETIQESCTVTAAEALNLRGGPGVRYTVINWLEAGAILTRLPTPPVGLWWKVTTTDNRTGWVNSIYCKE